VRVEWVHPSWRDLVIGRLKNDPGGRREFISRSGVHGAVLALSTAGGAAGERRLPLIGSDDDWDALTDRLYGLIPDLEPAELVTVLAALSETIDDLGDSEEAGEAQALARAVLSRTSKMWDAAHAAIPLLALDPWMGVWSVLRSQPPLPDLSITWVELVPTRAPALDDLATLERFTEWLSMCRLMSAYGVRLHDELGVGSDHADLMSSQVGVMKSFQDDVDQRRNTRGAEWFDAATLDLVLRALDSIAVLAPELTTASQDISFTLRMDTSTPQTGGVTAPPSAPTDPFDVRRVLADL
jgi:hypothetical protein